MDTVEWLAKNYGTVSLVATTVIGLIIRFRKFIKNAISTVDDFSSFRTFFGPESAKAIKDIHETLQTSHDVLAVRLELIEKHAKIGVYICGLDGQCIFGNHYLSEIFGISTEELLGFGWLSAIHPDERRRVNEEWMYAIKNRITYNCIYTVCNQREKKAYSIRTSAVAIVDDNKETHCYVGFIEVKNTKSLDCCFDTEEK